jgi:hypothetical protein
MSSFGGQLGAPKMQGGNNPFQIDDVIGDPGNSGNGKGNKKGHNKSPSEPI